MKSVSIGAIFFSIFSGVASGEPSNKNKILVSGSDRQSVVTPTPERVLMLKQAWWDRYDTVELVESPNKGPGEITKRVTANLQHLVKDIDKAAKAEIKLRLEAALVELRALKGSIEQNCPVPPRSNGKIGKDGGHGK